MKKIFLSLLLVLACAGLKAQVAAFEKMGKIEGVEYKCFNKDTISQILNDSKKLSVDKIGIDVFSIEGFDDPAMIQKLEKFFECVQILAAEDKDAAEKLKGEFEKFITKSPKYKLVTEGSDDDGENVSIYNNSQKGGIYFVEQDKGVYIVVVSAKTGILEILQQMVEMMEG